jgi:hypothetical protein
MSNIHADLIKNATDMQSQLLQFSHQLSNLSLKSLDDQNQFKMETAPNFITSATVGTASPVDEGSTIPAGTYISLTNGGATTYHRLTAAAAISGANGSYDLSGKIAPDLTGTDLNSIGNTNIKINTFPITNVTFRLNTIQMTVGIPSTGIPEEATGTNSTPAQKSVAQAMAVVAMNLRGVGVEPADIKEIFKNGITPTSLAAVESQLKGHHDAVLQLSLESLSRVTQILQKIAQKLGS